MTEQITDILTLGGGALLGKGFSTVSFLLKSLSDARQESHKILMAEFGAEEDSMKRAEGTTGGVWMRRAIYLLVAFNVIIWVYAGWEDKTLLMEITKWKGIWPFRKETVDFIELEGVPFLQMNKTAFLAIV